MKQKILVTGSSGGVGQHIIKQLQNKSDKYDVTAIDIETDKSRKILEPYRDCMTIKYGDITDKQFILEVVRDKDVILHLAAIIPPLADKKPDLAYEVNVNGTKNIINAIESSSNKTFLVYASSISVYGDRVKNPLIRVGDPIKSSPRDEYAITKIETERVIRNSSMDWTIFRLSAIMGINNHKLSSIMFHIPLNTSVEFTTPSDTARAFINAINHKDTLKNNTYNLGGGTLCRLSYEDFLQENFRVFGLGKLNFPTKAFAEKNFHCGYYDDGDILENILHFRRDDTISYFQKVKNAQSFTKYYLAKLFSPFVKRYLLSLSEPLKAYKKQNQSEIKHFFNL